MPSRINMGPDGGPYIAINENSGNIELEDNTGTTVAIWDDANSQWDFQNNPISNVDSLTSNSVNTDGLIIGGTLYEEDDNSPIDVSGVSSTQFSLANPSQEVVVLPQRDNDGFNQLRVEGDTDTNYDYVTNADSATIGDTKWPIPRTHRISRLHLIGSRNNEIRLSIVFGSRNTGETIGAVNFGVNPPVSQFTFLDSGGSNQSLSARVYRREMQI